MSGFRHEFQSLILIRNLTTYTHNVDGLKVCENAYILVGFIFRLVESKIRRENVRNTPLSIMPRKFKNYNFTVSPCCAC